MGRIKVEKALLSVPFFSVFYRSNSIFSGRIKLSTTDITNTTATQFAENTSWITCGKIFQMSASLAEVNVVDFLN